MSKTAEIVASLFSAVQRAFQAAIAEANTYAPHGNAVLTASAEFAPGTSKGKAKEPKAQSNVSLLLPKDSPLSVPALYVRASGNTPEMLRDAVIAAIGKVLHGSEGNFRTAADEGKPGTLKGRPSEKSKARAADIYGRHFTDQIEAEFASLIAAEKVSAGPTLAAYTISLGSVSVKVRVSIKDAETGPVALEAFALATGSTLTKDGSVIVAPALSVAA